MYDVVLARCKPITDDKLPILHELLAPVVLQSYDVKLARAIFLCTFAGFMRCCEYTESRDSKPNQNILKDSIICTEEKLGISFWFDKCSYNY